MWLLEVNFFTWGDEQILSLWRDCPHSPSRESHAGSIWKTLSLQHALEIEDFIQNLFPVFSISIGDLYWEGFIIELF